MLPFLHFQHRNPPCFLLLMCPHLLPPPLLVLSHFSSFSCSLSITNLWFRSETHSQMLWFFCLQRAASQPSLSPPLAAPETLVAAPSLLLSLWRNRWLLGGMCLLMHLKEQKSIKNRQSLSKSYSALVQNSYLMWGLSQRWSDTPAPLGLIKLDTHRSCKMLCLCTWTVCLCQSCTRQKGDQEERDNINHIQASVM